MKNLAHHNRQKLLKTLADGLIFLTSAKEAQRNGDVNYEFRQDSDFLYLSGIKLPGYSLLIDPKAKKSVLFIPNLSVRFQIWDGRQLTTTQAKKKYGFDRVFYHKDFAKIFKKLKKKFRQVYAFQSGKIFLAKNKIKAKVKTKALRQALSEARVFKSSAEIKLMKRANQISHHAHVTVMKRAKKTCCENELQGLFLKNCLTQGAKHQAYSPIIACGSNAAILHYRNNDQSCQKGQLILIDAGAEIDGYASDITRAFPVGGRFSVKQKTIYDIVLRAQKAAIKIIRPGVSMLAVHKTACQVIVEGLIQLGIFKIKSFERIFAKGLHALFFPHGIGHMLGLDVHDTGGINPRGPKIPLMRTNRVLEPGMVVTVEPGIYFIEAYFRNKKLRRQTAKYVDWKKAARYYTVGGIRIEDDLVVTKTGSQNLTTVPKEIRDIEKIMA